MKKCPVCDKTFEDSMRFCQVDGTPLVEDEPAFDPYATIVARREDVAGEALSEPMNAPAEESSAPVEETPVEAAPDEPPPAEAVSTDTPIDGSVTTMPIAAPNDVLDLPDALDPLKTMFVSEAELHAAFDAEEKAAEPTAGEPKFEEPKFEETLAPEPSSFDVPDAPEPGFGDPSPPPSPFSASESVPEPAAPSPSFPEPETVIQPMVSSPFEDPAPAPVAEWTPPPAPDAAWQNQEISSNTPLQPPPAGVAGQSKGMAMGSMICGILSCTICCSMGLVAGPVAIVLGFIAKKKADENPSEFSGRGLALTGMITGALGLLIGLVIIVIQLFFGGLGFLLR